MRWLLITQDFPPVGGGMSSYYYHLLRAFSPGEIGVITTRAESPFEDRALPFPIIRLNRTARQLRTQADLMLATPGIRRRVRELAPEALLVGNFRPFGYIARRLGRRLGLPYLPVFHGMDLTRIIQRGAGSRTRRRLYSAIARDAAGFVANTHFTARILREHFAREIAGKPVDILHPGIDLERFRPAPLPGDPLILTIARYAPRKGIDIVIRALPAIRAQVPGARYRVIAPGDPAPYAALAAELGVSEAVELQGPLPHDAIAARYADCAVFVMVPQALEGGVDVESFGMVFLEANACGRPVVASASGGVTEAVADGVSGLVVPPGDPEATAGAILRLLRDRDLAARLAAQGRARAEAEFAWPLQAAKLRDILERAIAP